MSGHDTSTELANAAEQPGLCECGQPRDEVCPCNASREVLDEVGAPSAIESLAIAWAKAHLTTEALGRDYHRACITHAITSCPECSMRICEHRETPRVVREAWNTFIAASGIEDDAKRALAEACKARLLEAT